MLRSFFSLLIVAAFLGVTCSGSEEPEPGITDVPSGESRQEARQWVDSILTPGPYREFLFENVNLVDVHAGVVLPGQYVVVRDGNIHSITAALPDVTENTVRIDGAGKYLSPGLADMHVHLIPDPDLINNLFLFLANGVTTVRVMWGFRSIVDLRDSINTNLALGPRMYVASAGFNGRSDAWGSAVITQTPEEVREYVRAYKDANFDFIKVYSGLPRDQYNALMDEASLQGIPAIGHLPSITGVDHASISGQRSVEHLDGLGNPGTSSFEAATRAMMDHQVSSCPTLTVINRIIPEITTYRSHPAFQKLSPVFKNWYDDNLAQPVSNDLSQFLADRMVLVRGVQQAGVNIIAGTDTGIRYIYPGYGLHEELQHYRNAGMSNTEVLKTATINAGLHLEDGSGVIRGGRRADLILLNANPMDAIENLKEIEGVMAGGHWLDRVTINGVMTRLERVYR